VWRQLAIVCASDFAVWLGAAAIFPYLPIFLKEEAHASLGMIGLIAGAYFVGVFAFSTPMGHLSDRVGRKPMMVFGTLLYAVATALFFTTDHAVWFMVFRLIEGIGAAAVVPAGQALVAEITTDATRSRAYGWLTSAQFGGMIVGPALAWPLYELGGGGRGGFYAIFLFTILLTLLTAVVMVLFLREPSPEHKAAVLAGDEAGELAHLLHDGHPHSVDRRPRLKILLSAPVLAIIVAVASAEFAVGAWEVVWSIWLREIGAPLSYIGLTWVAFSVPMLFSFAAGMAADRYSRYVLMTGGFLVLGMSWLAFAFTDDLTLYLVMMAVAGGSFAVAYPAKQAFLVQVSPRRWLGTIQGIEQTAMQLSALIGTLTAPLLFDALGRGVFVVSGGVALAGLAAAAPVLRREWRCVRGGAGVKSCAHARLAAVHGEPAQNES
jgi:DHA1 family multidrug resistance protein-like MFS transporter